MDVAMKLALNINIFKIKHLLQIKGEFRLLDQQ